MDFQPSDCASARSDGDGGVVKLARDGPPTSISIPTLRLLMPLSPTSPPHRQSHPDTPSPPPPAPPPRPRHPSPPHLPPPHPTLPPPLRPYPLPTPPPFPLPASSPPTPNPTSSPPHPPPLHSSPPPPPSSPPPEGRPKLQTPAATRAEPRRVASRHVSPHNTPLARELRDDALERFLRYVAHRHAGRPRLDTYPSTMKQLDLSRLLVDELHELGLDDASHRARLRLRDAAGPAARRSACRPRRHEPGRARRRRRSRRCTRATTAASSSAGLSPATSALLAERIGHDIVTSDGTTLLGADDKAGVAEIMAAVAWLVAHPEVPHARARIAFTVDEEVGHGVDHFDLEQFGADFAYTLDGSVVGEIENETLSALELKVTFHGVGVHPGHGEGQARQPGQARGAVRREPPGRHALARDDRGPRGVRAPARDRGRRRRRSRSR